MFSITATTPSSFPQTYEKESMEADISSPYSHLLQNLSFLKSKVQEAQSLLTLMLPPNNQHHQTLTTSITLVAQDIISVASSVMPTVTNPSHNQHESQQTPHDNDISEGYCDIIELDASDLLAKYTHYCQVCGKGFKRDANLRMHMRAHGDEYKSSMALKKPFKEMNIKCCYYSCPLEGCRWNKKHARFRPLKSLVCTKNHYKRSHCPKIYLCKRCNCKQFAVLSDLRTHEKHCGDAGVKWQCTCGVGFSRKDKLLGHVSLFGGGHRAVLP